MSMENPFFDKVTYKVIRNCKTSETSARDLIRNINAPQERINTAVNTLTESGFLRHVNVGEKDVYLVSDGKLQNIFFQTWSNKGLDRKAFFRKIAQAFNEDPENIQGEIEKMVERYMENYLENYPYSTLYQMACEDFIRGLEVKTRFQKSSDMENLMFDILKDFERPKRPYELL